MNIKRLNSIAAMYVQKNNKVPEIFCSSIFDFPQSDNYREWVKCELSSFSGWVQKSGKGIYNKAIEHELSETNNYIPANWSVSAKVNGIYVIADKFENVIYVGKAEYPVVYRLLDHLFPRRSERYPNGQSMNNTPGIWDDILALILIQRF